MDMQNDEFEFRPLTEGLGFHMPDRGKEALKEARAKMMERTTPFRPLDEHPYQAMQKTFVNESAPTQDFIQNGLSLFYRESTMTEEIPLPAPMVTTATTSLRFIAFLVDMACVGLVTLLSLWGIEALTGIDLWQAYTLAPIEITSITLVMAVGYFLIYFTVLEKFQGASLGKEVLNLKVVDAEEEGPTLFTSAVRAVTTLLGLFSLGFTTWADLPGKLTGTRVIRA